MRARRGFNLVELLMVIAVIGILISTVVPAIEGVQHAARQTASLSNLRQCVGIALSYTLDYDGMMPCYTDPSPDTISVIRWRGVAWTLRHMRAEHWWNIALADAYLAGNPTNGAISPWPLSIQPASVRNNYVNAHYRYSCTFQAAPEFFVPETRWATGKVQLRPVRAHETDFPGYKAVFTTFFRSDRQVRDGVWELGFADGSAAAAGPHRRGGQYGPGRGDWWPGKTEDFGHDWHVCHGMHTHHGCRGRDVLAR